MRMVFLNLPVKDVAASKAFFTELGFEFNPDFCADAAGMVIDKNVYVMLMTEKRFADFVSVGVSDATAATEVLICLSADSREQVDETIAKAVAAGGTSFKPAFEQGPMYGGSFQDIDGHTWELMYMGQD
jgi:uncharacterized protein